MNVEKKKPFVQSSFPFLLTRCEDWLIEVLNIRPKMGGQFFWRSKDIVCWVENDVKLEICLFIMNLKPVLQLPIKQGNGKLEETTEVEVKIG